VDSPAVHEHDALLLRRQLQLQAKGKGKGKGKLERTEEDLHYSFPKQALPAAREGVKPGKNSSLPPSHTLVLALSK